jgi:hypothetical protein
MITRLSFFWFHRAVKMRGAAVMCLSILVASCGSTGKSDAPENPNITPTNYRAEIINQIQVTLDDPSGIREAFIAEPALKPSGTETRYIACLRFNARNKDGTYMGVKEKAAFFYGGHLTTMLDATKEQCGNAPYQPFPELEKLCRVSGCPPVRR